MCGEDGSGRKRSMTEHLENGIKLSNEVDACAKIVMIFIHYINDIHVLALLWY